VTEEVWSWWRTGSVHRSAWPESASLRAAAGGDGSAAYGVAADVLGEIRKAKTTGQKSMRADVASVTVTDRPERLALLDAVRGDVGEAGRVAELVVVEGETFSVTVELADGD
jgi:valyl-tRNA synthetase